MSTASSPACNEPHAPPPGSRRHRVDRRKWLAQASRDASARAMMPWRCHQVEIDEVWAHAHALQNPVLARCLHECNNKPRSKPSPPPTSPPSRRSRSVGPNTPHVVARLREDIARNLRSNMDTADDGLREEWIRTTLRLPRTTLHASHLTPKMHSLQIASTGHKTRYLQLEADAAIHRKRVAKPRPKLPSGPLNIVDSRDIMSDDRFDVIVNSVSPEFSSANADGGVSRATWMLISGYRDALSQVLKSDAMDLNHRGAVHDGKHHDIFTEVALQPREMTSRLRAAEAATAVIPGPILHNQQSFVSQNCGTAPTYGDVLWTKLSPTAIASLPEKSTLRYIVHALGPDYCQDPACKHWTPYRLKSEMCQAEAKAVLFTAYYRALWQATLIAGPECSIGLQLFGLGEHSFPVGETYSGCNDSVADDARAACCLAHAVYRATGGKASVSIVLPSSGNKSHMASQSQDLAAALVEERKAWESLTRSNRFPFTCSPEGKFTDLNKSFTVDGYMKLLRLVSETLAPQSCEQQQGLGKPDLRYGSNDGAVAPAEGALTPHLECPSMIPMGELLLRQVPAAHTKAELVMLLQDKASLWRLTKAGSREKELCSQAMQYLKIMAERDTIEDMDAAKQDMRLYQEVQEGGKWSALFHSLKAMRTTQPCPFVYPSSPFGRRPQPCEEGSAPDSLRSQQVLVREMMKYLTSAEFLHFDLPRDIVRNFASGTTELH